MHCLVPSTLLLLNKHPRQDQFVGPGEHVVLRTDPGDAVFVWRAAAYRSDGEEGIECSLFRNEGEIRSSELIRQADAIADHCWPSRRHYTFVDPDAVRSSNPGFCFVAAGWRHCGKSKKGLLIMERIFSGALIPRKQSEGLTDE